MPLRKRAYVGLAATLHDPALAIVAEDGRPLFAEATERALQYKRAFNCPPDDHVRAPRLVQQYCGDHAEIIGAVSWSSRWLAGITAELEQAEDIIGTAAKPSVHPQAWPLPHPYGLQLGLRNSVSLAGMNLWSSSRLSTPVIIRRYDHHLTHAANAVYTSPFDECAVAVVDGYGEGSSVGFFRYDGDTLLPVQDNVASTGSGDDDSLGLFYARLCATCGFEPLEGEEWKVMGLAGYGCFDRQLYGLLRPLIGVDGLRIIRVCSPVELQENLTKLQSLVDNAGDSLRRRADLAHTGQFVFEETLAQLLNNFAAMERSRKLAFCGGCALNSSFNGRIVHVTPFSRVHVPSAPADDGNALGAAWLACAEDQGRLDRSGPWATPFLGSSMDQTALDRLASFSRLPRLRRLPNEIFKRTAELIANGSIIAWVQGKAEFGPRALGNRSLLADPRSNDIKDRLNRLVKFREEFRPFAPSILDEFGTAYFDDYQDSPYMERTLRFRHDMRDRVPGVVHVDGTGRLQSVTRERNPRFYDLISAFHDLTGVPLLLNTSLNIMGKPIVHSLEDCLGLLFTTGIDALVVEDYLIEK
jgi:carbamoyltransferase